MAQDEMAQPTQPANRIAWNEESRKKINVIVADITHIIIFLLHTWLQANSIVVYIARLEFDWKNNKTKQTKPRAAKQQFKDKRAGMNMNTRQPQQHISHNEVAVQTKVKCTAYVGHCIR